MGRPIFDGCRFRTWSLKLSERSMRSPFREKEVLPSQSWDGASRSRPQSKAETSVSFAECLMRPTWAGCPALAGAKFQASCFTFQMRHGFTAVLLHRAPRYELH